jgi:outer membrane protein assembly factor BamB
MFGLMEIQELLNSYNNLYPGFEPAIVPTVLLPLAFLSTGISVVATFVAGLFGVKLKAEGPKKLLELLLRPRILFSALILNALIYGGLNLYQYVKNGPVPLVVQKLMNNSIDINIPAVKGDGNIKWKQNIGEGIFTSGVIVDDEIFVGSKEGNLFVLNKETGRVKNKIFFGKFLSPTPVLYKGYLYFGEGLHASHHMRVYKFDPKKKEVVGAFKTKGHTEIFPVLKEIDGKDYLFQAAGADGIYAIDPHTMKKIWQFKDGHMDAFAHISGDDLYIGSGVPLEDLGKMRPFAYKLNVKTGKLIWKKELPLSSWYGPVQSKNRVCFIQGELHVKSLIGGINCLDENGNRVSSILIESPVIGKPLVQGDNIIFNDFNGGLYSWNSKNEKLNWSFIEKKEKVKYSYSSVQLYKDNQLLFINPKGKISFLLKDSGKLLESRQFVEKEHVFADPLINDGFLVFGMKGSINYYGE